MQGWHGPSRNELEAQHQHRERIVTSRLMARIDELEARVTRLERQQLRESEAA